MDKPPSLISDAEIENTIKELIAPLVKAANLNPKNINIRIVIDPGINAFVAIGTNIFINSGLLIKFADDPNVLYGVMAHEIAHIYAGHIIQLRGEHEEANKIAIGGILLGLATIVAGAPEVGSFIGAGSMHVAQRNLLKYSRVHENEADKIAVDLLNKTHNDGKGLIKLFNHLAIHQRAVNPDPYSITHPLSTERIASIKNAMKNKLQHFNSNINQDMHIRFQRAVNKLEAFILSPRQVIERNKKNLYALAIGYFRQGNLQKAIGLLDQVIAQEPNNPYLLELKGQFYFENGLLSQASQYYQKALHHLPNDPIITLELAISQINQAKDGQDKTLLNQAISHLNQVLNQQPNNLLAYFMLSRAYGKLGEQSKAILALAEYYFYQENYKRSKILADKVLKLVPQNSKEYLRANDIIEYIKDQK